MTTRQEHPNDTAARLTFQAAASTLAEVGTGHTEGRGPLADLWAIALLVEHGLVELGAAVAACRQDGVSDADIAGVLGVSRQAVSQRWVRVGQPQTQRVRSAQERQGTLPI